MHVCEEGSSWLTQVSQYFNNKNKNDALKYIKENTFWNIWNQECLTDYIKTMNAGLEFISIQNDYKKQKTNEDKSEWK